MLALIQMIDTGLWIDQGDKVTKGRRTVHHRHHHRRGNALRNDVGGIHMSAAGTLSMSQRLDITTLNQNGSSCV